MSVNFIYGGNARDLDSAVGQKARTVLPLVRKVMNIPAGAQPEINDEAINDDYVFVEGDEVTFYKASGEKGY